MTSDFKPRVDSVTEPAQGDLELRELFESAPDGIFVADKDGRYLDVNAAGCRLLGYTRDEILGRSITDLVAPEQLPRQAALTRHFLEGGTEVSEWRLRRKDGTYVPVELSGDARTVLIAAGTDYERVVNDVATLVVRDLADWCLIDVVHPDGVSRVKAAHSSPDKDALCRELESLRLDRSATLLSEVLASQRAAMWSELPPGFIDSVAQSPEHLRLLRELDPRSMIMTPLVARGHSLGALVLGRSSDRRYGPQDLALVERLASKIGLAIDNVRLYTALEHALEARDEVLAVVAHDLRNPLHALSLEAEVVRGGPSESIAPRALRFADVVTRTVERMNTLIQDLLDTARTRHGGLPISPAPIAPQPLLVDIAESQRLLAAQFGIELQLDVERGLPDIVGDAERLMQLFVNLLANALKFTESGGRITLGANRQGDYVVFRVEDNGRGIPPAMLPHVFDRFWQANPRDPRGAGLGLSIAKTIVEKHRGTIWVESQPGVGTTFRFTVPATPGVDAGDPSSDLAGD